MMDTHAASAASAAYAALQTGHLSLFCPAVTESVAWSGLAAANGPHLSLPMVPLGRMPHAIPLLHHANPAVNNDTISSPSNVNINNNNNNNNNSSSSSNNNSNSSSNSATSNSSNASGDTGHSSSCCAESPVAENESFLGAPQPPAVPAVAPLLPDHIGLVSRLPPTAAINLAHHASSDIHAGTVEQAAAAVTVAELAQAHFHTHVHHIHRNHLPNATALPYISVVRPDNLFHPEVVAAAAAAAAASLQPFHPYYYHQHTPLRQADYLRTYYHHHHHRHAPPPNRGATKSIIERNTFAHKYKRMKKTIEDERDEDIEKCTICLYEFEIEEDVR